MDEIDVEDSARLALDAAMTLEARTFKRCFGPLLCEGLESALLKGLVNHIVTGVEQRQAIFDVVCADALIDELNV